MEKKRIFIVNQTDESHNYGVGKYISVITKEAKQRHADYTLIILTIGVNGINNVDQKTINGIIYFNIPKPISETNSINTLSAKYSKSIYCLIVDFYNITKTDTFHFNSNMQYFILKEIRENTKAKIIYTIHVSLWKVFYQNNFEKFLSEHNDDNCFSGHKISIDAEIKNCELSDKIICLTKGMLKDLTEIYKIKKSKIALIPNGIENSSQKINSQKTEIIKNNLNLNHEDFTFLYIGRLYQQKGISNLINSIKGLLHDGYQFKLVVVGDGPLKPDLLIESIENRDAITFTGYIETKNIKYYYELADAIVFPSLNEQSSYVMLEAMANKVPMIVTDIEAFDILENEISCLKVPLNNKNKIDERLLKDTMTYIYNHPKTASFIAKNAYDLYLAKFTSDKMFDATYLG